MFGFSEDLRAMAEEVLHSNLSTAFAALTCSNITVKGNAGLDSSWQTGKQIVTSSILYIRDLSRNI
jgi:hypothetical protein